LRYIEEETAQNGRGLVGRLMQMWEGRVWSGEKVRNGRVWSGEKVRNRRVWSCGKH